jgi:hypothetical protein
MSLLAFSLVGMLLTYFILRFQDHLPLNPQKLAGLAPHLAFNTAASFTTNTNWQSYGGESTMSYFSQMVALVIHNFTSAAAGIAIAAALVRGIARQSAKTIGNFWVDTVRITYYLLVPDLPRVRALPRLAGHDPELQALHGREDPRALHDPGPRRPTTRASPSWPPTARPRSRWTSRSTPRRSCRARRLADRDQDARDERRRLHQRQRRASLREPHPALQLHPDALDLRHPERAHLLPRPRW